MFFNFPNGAFNPFASLSELDTLANSSCLPEHVMFMNPPLSGSEEPVEMAPPAGELFETPLCSSHFYFNPNRPQIQQYRRCEYRALHFHRAL